MKYFSSILLFLFFLFVLNAEGADDLMPKVKIIYENTLRGGGMKPGWGFSALIEFGGKKILFDAGGDERIFADNFQKAGLRPEDIDIIFISHEHWDHVAGLSYVLRPKQEVYLLKSFPREFKNIVIKSGAKLYEIDDFQKIIPAVYTTGALKGKVDEQSLIIDFPKGLIIITGCSHPGIVNIIKYAKQKLRKDVYLVFGGFHLYLSSIAEIKSIAQELKLLKIKKLAPCHCTGKKALSVFQKEWGRGFININSGDIIDNI